MLYLPLHTTSRESNLFYLQTNFQSDAGPPRGRRRRKAPERRSQRQMEKEIKEEADRIRKENQVKF